MPRGIYFSSLKAGSLGSQQGRAVAGIPSFLLKSYQKNRQPGLKPGLAGQPRTPPQTLAVVGCSLNCSACECLVAGEMSTTNWLPVVPVAAAGLLLCHELPLQTDTDGRASGRLLSLSQSYQHTLASLIREV